MRYFFLSIVLMLPTLFGCSYDIATCECFNPPTADTPTPIQRQGYALGSDQQAQKDACRNARDAAEFVCTSAGGSVGECTCEKYTGILRASAELTPIPDATVPAE